MRKKIVAGNWKMNTTLQEGIALAKEVNSLVKENDVDVVLCTPFIHLTEVSKVINRKNVFLGAQNCADQKSGAYTGEDSERRAYYGETNAILSTKVKLALENELTPIFCIGEVLEEREAGKHFQVVKTQLNEGLFDLSADDFSKIVIAYEPVWAIGTGKTATGEQAQEIHKVIRDHIASKYGSIIANNTSILYGGSCKASNAAELFANPDVDGGLIGGASLKAEDFLGIINA
jgi:triosephosphate isomerase